MNNVITNEGDAISYIHQLPRLHRKNDLSYVKRALAYFANPQDKIKTIHITGTNGKGSTSYYLNSLLQKAGFKTGLFVSPFITEFNERIQINSKNIAGTDLVSLTKRVAAAVADLAGQTSGTEEEFILTEFEFLVVMAFVYFAEQKVDFAIIEAGIGAKHDKTNVITPLVSIITSVGMDHEQLIGPTLLDIAAEKSGIIKNSVPVVVGRLSPDVLKLIRATAKKRAAPLAVFGRNFVVQEHSQTSFSYENWSDKTMLNFRMRPNVEQIDVAIAVTAFKIVYDQLSEHQIEAAIDETQIVGRYQVLRQSPKVIADGAHNVQAMTNFYGYLKSLVAGDATRIHFLLTMMKDKDLHEVLELISASDITLTTIDYPRAAKRADFVAAGLGDIKFEPDFKIAYKNLEQNVAPDDIIAISGSFYFVTDFLNYMRKTEDDK